MRIDLKTARVRPVGSSGIAHRTNAGFVMLGTADSRKVLSIVEQNADQSNLVELVIAELSVAAPEAFCFLFMSQGELFLLTCGSAVISLTTSTGQTTIEPQPEQVLIQRIDLGVGDSDGRLVLFQRGMTVDQVDGLDSVVDLQSGTVLADALDLTIARSSETASTPALTTSSDTEIASTTAPATATAATPSFGLPRAGDEPAGDDFIVEATAEPVVTSATTPAVASSMPPPPPPAADQIMFAEDIDEISGAVDAVVTPAPIPLDEPVIPTPIIEEPVIDIPQAIDVPTAVRTPDIETVASVVSLTAAAGTAAAVGAAATALPSVPPGLTSSPASGGAFSGVLNQTDEPASSPHADNGAVDVPPPATSVGPVMVLGVACPDGHHNHPDAAECSECAARIGEAHTTVLMNGPRPPLGVLMVDDGKTWSLASDIIIGREPVTHGDVAGGTASSMALTDDTLSLSRHHARISLDDWSAYVIDLGSSNGTYLNRNRSAQEWSPVPSDMALPLEPGDRLRVGGRIIQVELYQFNQ